MEAERMSMGKTKVIKTLKSKGIDPVKLEKELITMLREGLGTYDIRSHLKKLLEGEKSE
jgi:hypothetical protein